MLILEIENDDINQIGACPVGSYPYTVKRGRKVIATGTVEYQDGTKHWSRLLEKIAEDGRNQEFEYIMGVSPEQFMKDRKETTE